MIGGFHSLHEWHPAVAKCDIETEGDTTLRRLHLVGGGTILEKLEKSDDGQSYGYSILESPLPVKNYSATITVSEAEGGGCCHRVVERVRGRGRAGERSRQGHRRDLPGRLRQPAQDVRRLRPRWA